MLLGIGMADLALIVYTDLHEVGGTDKIALFRKNETEIPTRAGLAAAVTDFAVDGEGLLMVLDGALRLAESRVGVAQVAEILAFPSTVADLAVDGEGLLVIFDGAPRLTEIRVDVAQVAEI
jgi:hypothetical protein